MINVKYVSSSGKQFDFVCDNIKVSSGNFHSYAWRPDVTNKTIGDNVRRFKKEAITYQTTITVRGDLETRKSIMNDMTDAFEYDVIHRTPGTIIYGEYYIKAYVISSDTGVSDDSIYWSDRAVEFYCPYPKWIRKTGYMFLSTEMSSHDNKTYPGRYPYRYVNSSGDGYIINPNAIESNAEIVIFGPVVNPQVTIGKNIYMVNIVLEDIEYLTIDTRTKSIIKTMANGDTVNAFHCRRKGSAFFGKIEPGMNRVSWTGKFMFSVSIYDERSEPKWITQI